VCLYRCLCVSVCIFLVEWLLIPLYQYLVLAHANQKILKFNPWSTFLIDLIILSIYYYAAFVVLEKSRLKRRTVICLHIYIRTSALSVKAVGGDPYV